MSSFDAGIAKPGLTLADVQAAVRWAGDCATKGATVDWPDEVVQQMFATAIRIYVQRFDVGHRVPPISDPEISATSVMLVATMMLKSANLELFELGMWQAFSGVK